MDETLKFLSPQTGDPDRVSGLQLQPGLAKIVSSVCVYVSHSLTLVFFVFPSVPSSFHSSLPSSHTHNTQTQCVFLCGYVFLCLFSVCLAIFQINQIPHCMRLKHVPSLFISEKWWHVTDKIQKMDIPRFPVGISRFKNMLSYDAKNMLLSTAKET